MRLMEGHLGSHPVKLIVDELPTLNRLPAIPTALFEARKANISVVLGFQGDKQLESRYGAEYETMIASCHTAITLKQNDGRAAKRASESIGEQEIDRLVESRQDGLFARKTTSFALTRQREPLVIASELSGLKNLRGFLKYGNLVTRLRFGYTARPDRCVGIVPKPPAPPRLVPDLTDDQGQSRPDPASDMPYVVTMPPVHEHAPIDHIHEV
jgi:Type IV secretion-system coupling protein DNA-binding domain